MFTMVKPSNRNHFVWFRLNNFKPQILVLILLVSSLTPIASANQQYTLEHNQL